MSFLSLRFKLQGNNIKHLVIERFKCGFNYGSINHGKI